MTDKGERHDIVVYVDQAVEKDIKKRVEYKLIFDKKELVTILGDVAK